jgi:predicted transposase/invertase (TIGR01784 family)
MRTDPVFYRLFETSPETFFLVLGLAKESAREMAARYKYEALEFKETAHRLDGVFRPQEAGLPLYFLEVQFYKSDRVFANLLVKAYAYLERNEPGQAFVGVVLFAGRELQPRELTPYQALLDAGVIQCHYLDEMPEIDDAPLGLSILYLINDSESKAADRARALIARARDEVRDLVLRDDLIQLIEATILYKLPRLSREEIEAMLQVDDIRKSRVYQEAKEEGIEQGIEQGMTLEQERQLQAKLRSIAKLAAMNLTADTIADVLELDISEVRKHMTGGQDNATRE